MGFWRCCSHHYPRHSARAAYRNSVQTHSCRLVFCIRAAASSQNPLHLHAYLSVHALLSCLRLFVHVCVCGRVYKCAPCEFDGFCRIPILHSLRWSFTTSTANWVPNCFCGIHCGGCAIWFEAGGRQCWGCVWMFSSSRVCTKQDSLACIESADSDLWIVPQVKRAKGAFLKDISLFDIPLIA